MEEKESERETNFNIECHGNITNLPKWAFGICQIIPLELPPMEVPDLVPCIEDALTSCSLELLWCLAFPVEMNRKSCKATSPLFPPVTISGGIDPEPISLSNTARERAPPERWSPWSAISPIFYMEEYQRNVPNYQWIFVSLWTCTKTCNSASTSLINSKYFSFCVGVVENMKSWTTMSSWPGWCRRLLF